MLGGFTCLPQEPSVNRCPGAAWCRPSHPGRWRRPPTTCPLARGLIMVGPLVLRIGDPLGLAERCTELSSARTGWWCIPDPSAAGSAGLADVGGPPWRC